MYLPNNAQILREYNPEHNIPNDGVRVPWYTAYNAEDILTLAKRIEQAEARIEKLEECIKALEASVDTGRITELGHELLNAALRSK